jgi:hypothetical protein
LGACSIAEDARERLAGEAEMGETALAQNQDNQQLHGKDRGRGQQHDLIRFHER